MTRDVLLLLEAGFDDGGEGPFYCPACATLEGVLGYYPQLRDALDVHRVAFARPRAAVIALLGETHQGLPALVVADDVPGDRLEGFDVHSHAGRRFIKGPTDIGRYLSRAYGIAGPH